MGDGGRTGKSDKRREIVGKMLEDQPKWDAVTSIARKVLKAKEVLEREEE